jgi:hypothetical protein
MEATSREADISTILNGRPVSKRCVNSPRGPGTMEQEQFGGTPMFAWTRARGFPAKVWGREVGRGQIWPPWVETLIMESGRAGTPVG